MNSRTAENDATANFDEKILRRDRAYSRAFAVLGRGRVAALKALGKINIASAGWPFNQARNRNRGSTFLFFPLYMPSQPRYTYPPNPFSTDTQAGRGI